jgi:hypothetical protein
MTTLQLVLAGLSFGLFLLGLTLKLLEENDDWW